VMRAPITSVLIVFEMTGGYGLVLPLMIANTTAYVIARRFDAENLYDALLEQDGVRLLPDKEATAQLEQLRVEQAMTVEVFSLSSSLTAREALAALERTPHSISPVLDGAGRCLGLISIARLRRVQAEGAAATPISDLVRLREYVFADDPLIRAVVRMNAIGTRHLPVVAEGEPKLVGLITMSDVFRAQALAAADPEPSRPASESSASEGATSESTSERGAAQ
jgi:chloride channel protein, CIC family